MNNTIENVVKYYPELVDETFVFASVTKDLEDTNLNARAIKLGDRVFKFPKIATSERSGYNRLGHGGSNGDGTVVWEYETHELDFERITVLPVDHLDNEQAGANALSQAMKHHTSHIAVPETDTWRLSKLAGYTNEVFGNRVTQSIDGTNARLALDKLLAWARNNGIQNASIDVFVSPAFMAALSADTTVTKILRPEDTKGEVGYEIYNYLGLRLKVTPSERLYTECNLVANPKADGCHPTANSKIINFLAVEKEAVGCKRLLDYAKVFDSVNGGAYIGNFIGYKFVALEVGCCFVPDNKIAGIYANVSSSAAFGAVAVARVSAVAGDTATYTKITNIVAPNGMLYDSIYIDDNEFTIGSAPSAGTRVYIGTEFIPQTNGSGKCFVALVKDGLVVALSGGLTFPVAA